MKILIACEESQTVCKAFRKAGHEAYSTDIQECSGGHPEWHIQGDAMTAIYAQGKEGTLWTQDLKPLLIDKWDMMIAHPPCTYLSYVGLRHWNKPGRKEKRDEAMKFFMQMINAPIKRICVENPLGEPSKAYRKPDQTIHPYYFGDEFMKRTCLWLKNLPKLEYRLQDDLFGERTATKKPEPLYHLATNGKAIHFIEGIKGLSAKERQKARSKFWNGIAEAMVEQWGCLAVAPLNTKTNGA